MQGCMRVCYDPGGSACGTAWLGAAWRELCWIWREAAVKEGDILFQKDWQKGCFILLLRFWILLSLFFATHTPQRLREVILSAISFAIAILSKENAIFMAPAIVYIIWIYSRSRIRTWSITLWISLTGLLVMLYPLYAFLKN